MASKYRALRTDKNGIPHGYASRKEAKVAGDLKILAAVGKILELREQVPFTLVQGRNGVSSVKYIADFTWVDSDTLMPHVADVKGMRTPVYNLKKRLMYLLCGITIEEL